MKWIKNLCWCDHKDEKKLIEALNEALIDALKNAEHYLKIYKECCEEKNKYLKEFLEYQYPVKEQNKSCVHRMIPGSLIASCAQDPLCPGPCHKKEPIPDCLCKCHPTSKQIYWRCDHCDPDHIKEQPE